MSSFFIRLFATAKLKSAVGYALRVTNLLVDAISGVLDGDGLSDAQRSKLSYIFTAIVAVRDFLSQLAEIVGTEVIAASLEDLENEAQNLNKVIDSL